MRSLLPPTSCGLVGPAHAGPSLDGEEQDGSSRPHRVGKDDPAIAAVVGLTVVALAVEPAPFARPAARLRKSESNQA